MAAVEQPPASLVAAVGSGSRLTALKAIRDRLAADLDDCDSKRDVSSLAQRLMDVLEQIDALGGGVVEKRPETRLDEFTKRLRDRESAPARSRSTAQ
ncbi:MAG: hypothetical protein JWO69_2011 [Thermoleophilia bacterium]|nr:hypothetical protein [Thermoleophilia bacterium]